MVGKKTIQKNTQSVDPRPLTPYQDPDSVSPFAHTSIPDASTAVIVNTFGARAIMIQAIDQNYRITLTGDTPTATYGFRVVADDPPVQIDLIHDWTTFTVIEEAVGGTLEYMLLG